MRKLEDFPRSIDKPFMIRDEMDLTAKNQVIVELGVYEKWSAGLNTCSQSRRFKGDGGFTFDIRNIATGERFLNDTTDAPMQWLRGDSWTVR